MVTRSGSLVQLCCGDGGTLQIPLVCGGSARRVRTALGLPRSRQRVLPGSTLLRLQGAMQRHCPKQALCFVHVPGLRRSGSQTVHKGTGSAGCVLGERTVPGGRCVLLTPSSRLLAFRSAVRCALCAARAGSAVLCVSSGS